ncbi:anhydro-N-acetylmuramic acid kinase [Nonlabens antarcticus]|uniref:anhydro-N-acetylmuramic acid kinase n=1 Tax=Nonlabens antarcticus TaxID=392714 RepID=UPI001891E452|nr:anhydro-N-acetylmuramic acid kinase [Nonlabens antarcticus]
MNHQQYSVIGVMSGTSLDGIDLVHVKLTKSKHWNFEILAHRCVNYTVTWKQRLQTADTLNPEQLKKFDADYTALLGDVCNSFIADNKLTKIMAICSHGHTILHQPHNGFTLQIGNLPDLATLTNHLVVCDFRVQDVNMGGQGAPLVPIGDKLLFADYDYCLNLGGFANLSFENNNRRIAYDICAVNVVLNHYASLLGAEYDDKGAFAKAGSPQPQQLKQLNKLPFYTLQPPKSLGIEWVRENIMPILEPIEKPEDAIATFTDHAAKQIAGSISKKSSVLITGGGAYNSFLIDLIRKNGDFTITLPESKIIEYKEAVVFALLGVLRLRNEVNCLSSVTGASSDHCSGVIHTP